ncbi:MAG: DUF2279 domain-containing protein [Prolixibacteraceae bacterium]|jgi:uncharacterized protein YfiM (DUF2279 family)|nr:DUF2279 domain-containing protein [Prolixibacteraceae bacterium]
MKKTLTLFFIVAILFSYITTHGQTSTDSTDLRPVNKNMVARAATTGGIIYAGGLSYLSFIWYSDKERVPFHFYNDTRGYLQIDKMGHSFAAYSESYIAYNWLRKAGMSKAKALLYGGSMGFVLQAPIEVFDGLYKGWGFSWGDIAANTAGSFLLVGQELIFDEQILRYKISFSPSEMSKNSYGYLGDNLAENFAYDYNGHTYWLSMNANRIKFLEDLPPWINIAAGYSANGMLGEFENRSYYYNHRLPDYTRTRQFLLSLDIDWQKIPTNSQFLRCVFAALNFVKLPFPAIEINSQGKFEGHWLYF